MSTELLEPKTWRKAWHLGDDVDTDALAPGAYMQHGIEVIAAHCLESLMPAFARDVRPGDVIVAGRNFGIGSSREQAAAALVQLGIRTVIAQSFGGLFFRNAFNLGLVLLTCEEDGATWNALRQQDQLALHPTGLTIELPSGERLECAPIPDFLLTMARNGGLMASLKLRRSNELSPPHSTH